MSSRREGDPLPRLATLYRGLARRRPSAAQNLVRRLIGRPPRARARRRALRRLAQATFAACSRRDPSLVLIACSDDVELVVADDLVDLGFEQRYRGHEGIRRFADVWARPWSELLVEPSDVIDRGEVLVIPLVISGKGRLSGMSASSSDVALALTTGPDGLVAEIRLVDWPEVEPDRPEPAPAAD